MTIPSVISSELGSAYLAFLVSSATWPAASNPTRMLEVKRNDNIQFHPELAPVPLSIRVFIQYDRTRAPRGT